MTNKDKFINQSKITTEDILDEYCEVYEGEVLNIAKNITDGETEGGEKNGK